MNEQVALSPSRRSLLTGAVALGAYAALPHGAKASLTLTGAGKPGASGPATFLGIVANKAVIPDQTTTGAKWVMSREPHIATATIVNPVVLLPNSKLSLLEIVETGSGGTITYTYSIEYPIGGTRYPATFSGRTAPNGLYVASDPIVGLTIPAGASFYEYIYQVGAVGVVYHNGRDFAGGSINASGSTPNPSQDVTVSGTITDAGNNTSVGSIAILSQTTAPSVVIVGDSIAAGIAESAAVATDWLRGTIARGLPSTTPSLNLAVSTATAQPGSTNDFRTLPLRYALLQLGLGKYTVSEIGGADIYNNIRTSAQTIADVQNLLSVQPAYVKTYLTTLIPKTSGSWATTGGQSTLATEPQRQLYNAAVRAVVSGTVGTIDCTAAIESSLNSGLWAAPPTNTDDGTHPNATGNPTVVTATSAVAASIFT